MVKGYLAPEGDFVECPVWTEQTGVAQYICKKKYGVSKSGTAAENYILYKGYIVIRERSIYKMTDGRITELQRQYLKKNMDKLCVYQRRDAERMMGLFEFRSSAHGKHAVMQE